MADTCQQQQEAAAAEVVGKAEVEGEEGKDHISCLPDSILIQILSLLPSRLAVHTSLLSSRWRYLWRFVSDLSFHDHHLHDTFVDFIDAFLRRRDHSFPIRSFLLDSPTLHLPLSRLNAWIKAITATANGKPSLLSFHLSISNGLDFPLSLPSSLVHLSLRATFWDVLSTLPPPSPTPIFPSLSSLRLSSVDLIDVPNEMALSSLIYSCPNLSHLSFEGCFFSFLAIEAPSLRSLTFHYYDFNDVRVQVRAPHLNYLDHRCEAMEVFHLNDMPELVRASFDFRAYTNTSHAPSVVQALRGLSSATVLTFYGFSAVFNPVDREEMENLPEFHNLRDLTLIYSKRKKYIFSVDCLLQLMPNLEVLTIEEAVLPSLHENDRASQLVNMLPQCHLDRLDDVEVDRYVDQSNCLCDKWKFFFCNKVVK